MKTFLKNKAAVIPAAIIIVIALMAVLAPFLSPYDAMRQDLLARLTRPGAEHLFGTDELGRDVYLYGYLPVW